MPVDIQSGSWCIFKTTLISKQLEFFTQVNNVSLASSEDNVNIILLNDGGLDAFLIVFSQISEFL